MSFIDVQRRLQVGSTLGLSRRTVERRVKAGEIPALELGGPRKAIRVPADELDAWLESEPQDAASWLRGFNPRHPPRSRSSYEVSRDTPPRVARATAFWSWALAAPFQGGDGEQPFF